MSHKIILNANDSATCPHCDKQFSLQDGLTHQLIEQYENEYDSLLAQERTDLEKRITREIERKSTREFSEQIDDLKIQLQESQSQQKKEKTAFNKAKKKVAESAREEVLLENQTLKEELEAKDEKLVKFRKDELKLHREKKKLVEQKEDLALEVERKLDSERQVIEQKVYKSFSLKEAELKKKISDAQKANEDLTRKLEQGSQQLQGEVLELEVESLLEQAYPLDHIDPVKKGARGADVIQSVILRSGTVCGKIVWETKRAENWSSKWVTKLKGDLQRVNGDIAVLVSTAFPADISEAFIQYEGIWLVRPELVIGLSAALRTVLIEAQRQRTISSGKGEQMEALFDYICSNQFAQRVRAIVDSYEQMRVDLEKEKSAMQRLWKKREGQIMRISEQMLNMSGELQGISEASFPMLESIAGLDFAFDEE